MRVPPRRPDWCSTPVKGATLISLLCPSRGRPEQLARFCASAFECASDPDSIEVLVYADADDQGTQTTLQELESVYPGRVRAHADARKILSQLWNELSRVAHGEILGQMGDDIIFQSSDWDLAVMQAFERFLDRICFVHGNDLVHGERLGTHGFLHRKWVNTLGYFVPPYFSHDYNDQWLTEVADAIGRHVYLPELITEHMHPDVGKAEYDQTYREHQAAGARDDVAALYTRLASWRATDAEKLRKAIRRFNEELFGPIG